MHHQPPRSAAVLVLTATSVLLAACASTGTPRETQNVVIEVLNNAGPSFEARITIDPAGHRDPFILGFVPLGETRVFHYTAVHGRHRLSAVGGSHGQTAVLTTRNPKRTAVTSNRFTIDGAVDRIIWKLETNHIEILPDRR